MDNPSTPEPNNQASPEAETLQARSENSTATPQPAQPTSTPVNSDAGKKLRRRSYRPNHKATFIGVAAVFAILAVNAVILGVVLKKQAKNDKLLSQGQVTISTADLNRLGINRSAIGDTGAELIVAPDAQFKGKLSVAGETTLGGQLTLNSKLVSTDASFTKLQAGDTLIDKLNVNKESTMSTLSLRQDLSVTGTTRLQGAVTIGKLLTVANSVNIAGNLAIGGSLSVNSFSVRTIVINGHLITSGPTPSVTRGSATGSNGSVSISGNDSAGAVAINIGVGASGGTLASVTFRTAYGNTPKVVITPVGIGGTFYVSNVTTGGFNIGINSGLPIGGYRVNYIVEQ